MGKKNLILIVDLFLVLFITSIVYAADVHLAWDPPSSLATVTGYRIYYGTSAGNHPIKVEVGNTTDYIVPSLDPDTTYYFVIRAYNDYYESPDSNEFLYTPSGTSTITIPTTTPTTTPGSSYIWIHAESKSYVEIDPTYTVTPPIETVEDANSNANCKKYIWKNPLLSQPPAGDPEGEASYGITIEENGDYVVWGRVIAEHDWSNSFFVKMIDEWGNTILGDTAWGIQTCTDWTWRMGPTIPNLSSGSHTLKIKGREDGTKLDKILITNDMSYVPAGEGEGPLCPPTGLGVRSTTSTVP